MTEPAATETTLRRGFVLLAVLGVLATAVELALIRHWNGLVQLVPWFSLAVAAAAIALLVARPTPAAVRVVRVLAGLVMLTALFGVYEHVLANYRAGPLDFRYSATWATMPVTSRWWKAITQTVGPAPDLAPLVLAWSSLCVLFATIGHPGKAASTSA